jgi:hypothetical protein
VKTNARTATVLAWSLWLATFGCCAAGLAVTLGVTRPLTAGTLAAGAFDAFAFRLSFATIGLVLTLRLPANPISWLYAAAGLVWSLDVPLSPWVEELVRAGRPLPLAAQLGAVAAEYLWAPAITLAITLPFLLVPDGRLRSRRWRVVAASAVAGPALLLLGGSLQPVRLDTAPIDNPFGLAGAAGAVAGAVAGLGIVLHLVSLPAALICVVCGSGTPGGSSASSFAGSRSAPPWVWPGCWRGPSRPWPGCRRWSPTSAGRRCCACR